jgi:hypothetical protein
MLNWKWLIGEDIHDVSIISVCNFREIKIRRRAGKLSSEPCPSERVRVHPQTTTQQCERKGARLQLKDGVEEASYIKQRPSAPCSSSRKDCPVGTQRVSCTEPDYDLSGWDPHSPKRAECSVTSIGNMLIELRGPLDITDVSCSAGLRLEPNRNDRLWRLSYSSFTVMFLFDI